MVEILDKGLDNVPDIDPSVRAKPRHPEYVGRLNSIVNELVWTGVYYMKDSHAYNALLEGWTDIVARKKMERLPSREMARKLESEYMSKIYDAAEEREGAFRKLKYDLGDVTRGEIRQVLKEKLDSYLARKSVLLHAYITGPGPK